MQKIKNTRINRIVKKAFSLMLVGVMAVSVPGCGADPKDVDEQTTNRAPIDNMRNARNLVDPTERGTETGKTESEDKGDYTTDGAAVQDGQAAEMKEIEHYKTSFSSSNGLLSVDVDAPVLVPECDAYPILSVKRDTIDDGLLKKAKELLLGEAGLYDGVRLYDAYVEKTLAKGEEPDPVWKISGQVPGSEIGKYPVTVQLSKVSDLAEKYSEVDHFKDYYGSLMPDGELFYGVTDGKDGTYASLCVTNSKRYGSSLKFVKSKDYNVRSGLVLPGLNIYSWPVADGIDYVYDEKRNPVPPVGVPQKMTKNVLSDGEVQWEGDGTVDPDFMGFSTKESEKETNGLTKDEAVRKAEELLSGLGIRDDYAIAAVQDEYITDTENLGDDKDSDGKYGYCFTAGRAWHIVFQRGVNGNLVENFGEKFEERGGKKIWSGEVIEVFVNDNGIVGLAVSDPLTVDEVVVENGSLLDFAKIRETYEKSQLEALNQSTSFDSILSLDADEAKENGAGKYTFKIDRISLRYVRITEKNEFTRGYLVPVWSFEGTCNDEQGNTYAKGSFLEINAVDGTVYNAELGY